jgi:hypothetical protein
VSRCRVWHLALSIRPPVRADHKLPQLHTQRSRLYDDRSRSMLDGVSAELRATPSGESYRLLSNEDGLGIAEIGTTLLVRWRGAVTPAPFERQRAALEAMAARHPGGANLLCVIEEGAAAPDSVMRKATSEMVAQLGDRVRCIACVVEGRGFKAAAVRSVLSSMALLRKIKVEQKFTATFTDAAHWIALRVPNVSVTALCDGHEQLKQSMPPWP